MNYKFELTEQEANIVIQALAKQPYDIVSPIIAKLQSQAQVQQKLAEEPKAKKQ